MLFVTKNGTRKQVTKAARPMVRMVEMTGGIPSGFWEDPIILGFLNGSISAMIYWISNDKYKNAEAGDITIGVFIDLLGTKDGMAVSSRTVALLQDETYIGAAKAGLLSVLVARHGPEKLMDQAIVVEAVALSKETRAVAETIIGPISDGSSVGSAIQDLVYRRRVEALRA